MTVVNIGRVMNDLYNNIILGKETKVYEITASYMQTVADSDSMHIGECMYKPSMPHLKTSGCTLITDLGGVEVEDPEQTSSLKHKQLVSVMLPTHIATPTSEE